MSNSSSFSQSATSPTGQSAGPAEYMRDEFAKPQSGGETPKKSKKPKKNLNPNLFGAKKIKDREVLYLIDQMAIMFETGMNLLVALDCLTAQAKNPALKQIVLEMRDAINEGASLATAMAQHPRAFDAVCLNMVRAGELSGNMDEMLRRLSDYKERDIETRSRIKSALSYPIVMLSLAVVVIAFLIVWVFPKFAVFFIGNEDLLPIPTRIFLWLGEFCKANWYFVLGGIFVSVVGLIYLLKQPKVQAFLDRAFLKIPFLGNLITKSSLSRSFHTLSVLLHCGIPIMEALKLSQEVAGNTVFRDCWIRVASELENGRDLATPLRESKYFPTAEVEMLSLGERSGHLTSVLTKLSKHYEKEIDSAIKGLIKFVEPALIICMGFLVAIIVMSLILPIFSISRCQG